MDPGREPAFPLNDTVGTPASSSALLPVSMPVLFVLGARRTGSGTSRGENGYDTFMATHSEAIRSSTLNLARVNGRANGTVAARPLAVRTRDPLQRGWRESKVGRPQLVEATPCSLRDLELML